MRLYGWHVNTFCKFLWGISSKGVAIDPTCINIRRLNARNQTNAF